MKSERILYKIGYVSGYIFQFIVYGGLVYGLYHSFKAHEFPYLPFIFWMVYIIFKKVLYLVNFSEYMATRQGSDLTEEDVVRLINIVNYQNSRGFGPN